MSDIVIRPCRVADLPAVSELLGQLGDVTATQGEFDVEGLHTLYHSMAQYPDMYLNLVAEVDGQVAGFLSLLFYQSFLHHVGTAQINELVVDRERRGAGIGGALIRRAVAEAQARRMDEVEVGTENDNEAAQRFYHKHGFNAEFLLLGMDL